MRDAIPKLRGAAAVRSMDRAFREFEQSLGSDPIAPIDATHMVLAWYRDSRIREVVSLQEDGDGVLFEWGAFNSEFVVRIVRQVLVPNNRYQPTFYQTSIEPYFQISQDLAQLGNGTRWCFDPKEADELAHWISTVPAVEMTTSAEMIKQKIWPFQPF